MHSAFCRAKPPPSSLSLPSSPSSSSSSNGANASEDFVTVALNAPANSSPLLTCLSLATSISDASRHLPRYWTGPSADWAVPAAVADRCVYRSRMRRCITFAAVGLPLGAVMLPIAPCTVYRVPRTAQRVLYSVLLRNLPSNAGLSSLLVVLQMKPGRAASRTVSTSDTRDQGIAPRPLAKPMESRNLPSAIRSSASLFVRLSDAKLHCTATLGIEMERNLACGFKTSCS